MTDLHSFDTDFDLRKINLFKITTKKSLNHTIRIKEVFASDAMAE